MLTLFLCPRWLSEQSQQCVATASPWFRFLLLLFKSLEGLPEVTVTITPSETPPPTPQSIYLLQWNSLVRDLPEKPLSLGPVPDLCLVQGGSSLSPGCRLL